MLDGFILLYSGEGVRLLGAAIVNKPTKAIDARITGGLDTDYEFTRLSTRDQATAYTGWQRRWAGRAESVPISPEARKEGLVHTEKDIRGSRSILKVQAANWSLVLHKGRAGRVR